MSAMMFRVVSSVIDSEMPPHLSDSPQISSGDVELQSI